MNAEISSRTRVLIVGGGTAGWMTAAALCRVLPRTEVDIQLVESAEIGTVGVGEATVPHIRFFNARLGIDEADFMRRTQATFKLGIEFRNWARKGDSYIHPFGAYGEDLAGVKFHQHWLRARQAGLSSDINDFSLPVLAALDRKFQPPATDPADPLSTYSYAYQFDASLYAAFLRDLCEANGVKRTEGKVTEVQQNPESGNVLGVTLDNGETLEADFFVDCSGFRGLLIEQTLGAGYEEWSHWLPCDRAWAVPCSSQAELTPYTRATAHDAGWFWRIPLQHRVGNGHVFSSSYCSDEQALDALTGQLEGPALSDPRLLRFTTGRRRKQWSHNVVSIGLSSGFLEPLESTSIHLIQLAVGYLIDLFPGQQPDPASEKEFNRIMNLEYERVRDFLILHYHATGRDDTDFWNYCRTMDIPDTLSARMELFSERGVVATYREGMFLDASWLAVYFGQNVMPAQYDPASERVNLEDINRYLGELKARYREAVDGMPGHHEYLGRLTGRTANVVSE